MEVFRVGAQPERVIPAREGMVVAQMSEWQALFLASILAHMNNAELETMQMHPNQLHPQWYQGSIAVTFTLGDPPSAGGVSTEFVSRSCCINVDLGLLARIVEDRA